jgi:hypothetical protein
MLLGWYLDELVVYLFRTIGRLIAEYDSKTWIVAEGKVEQSAASESIYPLAKVCYVYTADGKSYSGTAKRAFWLSSSASRYADRFTPTTTVSVRYNPNHPAESVLRKSDQRI